MKRRLFFIILFAIFGITSFGQYVTILGKQFKDENGNDFEPVVCNYNVDIVNIDTSDFLTTYISPNHSFGIYNTYECSGTESCDDQLKNDFIQMLYMGFNTVRIMGINPFFISEGYQIKDQVGTICWECPELGFYIFTNHHNLANCKNDKPFPLHEPFENDAVTLHLVELINHLIQVASEVEWEGKKLKLILITGGEWGGHSHDFPDVYSDYLYALSNTLPILLSNSAKTTLMAYDLYNEPPSFWPVETIGHSKQDVCKKVKMWYDTIKEGDPYHLITLGAQGHHSILEYDHAVFSLDFYSPHLYPAAHHQYEGPTYFESLMNSFYGKLYWVSNNCKMPWIIGETGFRAVENSVFDTNYDGTLSDQYDFADSATIRTWECGGSGFSWWFYQDVCNDGYGILKQNQVCTNWPCSTILKPVWEVFDDFTPPSTGACSEPPYYYDPYYHEVYAPPDTNIVTGYVLDREDNPIKDAVIFAHTRLYNTQNPANPVIYDFHYTFTDDNGLFTVIPYDFDTRPPNYNTIEGLTISAAICSRVREWCSVPWDGVDSGQTFKLDRFDLNS
ncbi:MAG: hypothetical protein V1733_02830, partial [bacterium]